VADDNIFAATKKLQTMAGEEQNYVSDIKWQWSNRWSS